MAYQVQLPDGSLAWVDDSVPRSKALDLAKGAYPDAFPAPPGVLSQVVSAPKEFVKGAASGIVQAVGGLGALPYAAARYAMPELKPFEETAFGKRITEAEQYLAPSDEGVVTQLAGGLGSFASIFGPQALLRGVGGAGRLATGIAPRAAAPVSLGQVSGLGVEEARQRAVIARGDGVEVSPGEELAALSIGVPIGLTELLPVEKLFKGLDAGLSDGFKFTIANLVKRGLQQGGVEGAQEVAAGLMQDLSAKGVYNPNLEVGDSMLGEFTLGAGVGAIAQTGLDLLLRKDIQRAYTSRLNKENEERLRKETEALRLKNEEEIATTKRNLGIEPTATLALPAPAPQIQPIDEVDPLMNPVGFFNANELTPDYLKAVNNIRDKEGKAKLQQFSIEDLADAGAPQGEIDRLLAYKTGYQGQEVNKQNIFDLAQQKNIDVRTPGFADFLNRATGTPNVDKMSPVQLYSAWKALDAVEQSAELQVLPQGTNATRFTQDQYDRSIKNIKTLFPEGNLLGRSKVIKEIKDYSGLESDRDAESLLQTAIRNGDLVTVSSPIYQLVNKNGNVVRRYKSRKFAQDAAAQEGLSVREGTSIDIAFPGDATQLPGGPDIRRGTFKQGVAPEAFEVRSPDAVLFTAKTQEEADAKADRLFESRKAKAQGLMGQIAKHEANIAKSRRKLESLEADGKADTFEYKKMAAGVDANNKNLQNEINRLKAKVESYAQPLEVSAKGEKPVGREGYTLFEQGQPVATFPNHEMATEAAVMRFDDDTLQKVATLGAFQKGLIPKDLSIKAKKEQERRRGQAPVGFGVEMTGTKAEAEARLAEAGVFTGDFKKIADDLNKKLRPVMDKLGLGDLRLNILKAIKSPMGTADGYYVQRLIAIAMDAKNPIRTLRHEGIHALKELGAFTPEQWAVLERKAKSEWVDKYDIKKRYKGLTESEMLEEAISDAFSDFDQTKPPAGLIGSLFRKIKNFMEAFGNGIKGFGFQTADDIFTGVEEGKFRPTEAEGAAEPSYALKPMSIKEVRVYEKELEDLVKKIGSRIAGMKSGETLDHVRKAVKKLQSYTEQGLKGKDWYENSANAVLEAFNGDPILAEKFFQIIAITSANTEVAANFTKAYNAWSQFAEGKPIKAGTKNENKKIDALLNFGEDWDGRKTNSFYTNLMEAMEGKDTGRSTIDLHMTRMLFDKDAPTEAQYELAENMVRLLSSKVDMPARQIQAAAWVTQKARSMFDDYRAKGWKKNLSNDELMEFAFERALADYSHYIKAKVKQLPITKELREPSPEIRARVQNITGEVIPSVKTEMSQVEEMEFSAKEKLTKQIAKSNMVQDIANLLDIDSKVRITVGSGAYKSNVNPNLIVQVVNDNPEVAKQDALDLANAMSYVFKQDATPFFRADLALIGSGQLGYRFKFDPKALTPAKQKKILKVFSDKFGGDVGFTRVRANEIVIINYRGEDGTPFLASDENFVNGLAEIRDEIDKIATIKAQEFFGAESEYPYHDWEKDTAGTGLIEGIFSRRPQRPNLQRGLDNFRESFVRQARDAIEELGKTPRFSLRSDELVGGSGIGGGISIREQQPNAQSYDAVHYGKQRVNSLAGSMYGTGIKGAEAQRVFASPDPRVRQRAYFYIPYPNGRMPMPEAGLGNEVHIQRLNNLLGPSPEAQALSRAARTPDGQFDANAFESSVIDAGYDGYAIPDMGMAVVLGADVPVQPRGTRQEIEERPEEGKIQIGDRKYSLRSPETPEFKKWFGNSKVVDDNGKPLLMYHGTPSFEGYVFKPFETKNRMGNIDGYYFTSSVDDANDYAGLEEGAEVIPAYLSIKNPYVPGESPVTKAMRNQYFKEMVAANDHMSDERAKEYAQSKMYYLDKNGIPLINAIGNDGSAFQRIIKAGGYDGYQDGIGSRHFVAFESNQVKSAFNQKPTESPDIRYSLRQTDTDEFKQWFDDSQIVNEDGSPKVMYHGTARDITEFKPKQANAIFVTDSAKFAEGFGSASEDYMVNEFLDSVNSQQTSEIIEKAIEKGLRDGDIRPTAAKSLREMSLREASRTAGVGDYIRDLIIQKLSSGPNIMPLYVRAEVPFDYENEGDIDNVMRFMKQRFDEDFIEVETDGLFDSWDSLEEGLSYGDWQAVEHPFVQEAIKMNGHDSFYVKEGGRKNLGVYDPNQIKSAIGNIGTFSRTDKDIRYALALGNIEPSTALVPDDGGSPDGNMGLLPERLGAKPIRLLVGTHDDIENKGYGANHILNRVLSDPRRMPEGTEETLEKIARTAQRTAQNYKQIFKDGNKLVLFDGKNSLVLSTTPDQASIVTMFTQANPQQKYGAPVWTGRAPVAAEFLEPVRGIRVEEREGRVAPRVAKAVVSPSRVMEVAPVTEMAPTKPGKISLAKRFSLRDTLDPATVQSIDRTTTAREEKGFVQRMAEAISPTAFQRLRQGMINKYESIERLSQDVAEKFGSKELLADTSAIASALFSDRAAGVAASSFRNGVPIYRNGFTSVSDFNGQVKGLIPILEPLTKYGDPYVFQAFQFYAATKRGKRLTAEGREKLFTPAEIQQGALLEQQYPEFKQVFDEYQKYNKGLVDFMKDTGVLSEEEAKIWTQNWDYIPFYRQMEGEEIAGPRVFSPIAGVSKPKKLKGGEAPLADFMETVVRNSRAAIEAGMKNVAAQKVVRDILRLNQGEFVPAPLARGSDIVTVKENGKTKHYRVDDPLLVEALKGLNLPQLPFLEILSKPAEVLRNLVTKDPGFMLANLMRDSLQAWVTTGTNITPIVDTFKQYGQALAGMSPEAQALANAGLFAGYDFGGDVKSTAREVEAELRKRAGQRTAFETATLPLSKMWELLDKGSSASDVATRAEVYKRTLAETGNEAEALYQAMEVLNFSRKGNSALIRVLTATIPFMNARIQGLDVLYRAGFGKMATRTKERQQKAFITRGLTLFALSSMYWMLASDTEEYKTAEPEARDNNWIIGSVRIPIPFEIGTIFKVFPERIYEYFFGEDTSRDLKESIVRNLTSTLAFNPIPQAVLPIVENVANYSFFTGQPIVGKGLEDVSKPFQATPGTSLLAQEVGQATGQSPIMIDNLIRGYTGTIGTYAVMALDSIMRGEGDPTKATMKAEQLPVIKRFFASPEATGTITAYYDLKNRVDEATRTVNFLERTGGVKDLQEYLQDKGAKLLSIKPYVQQLDKEMTTLREMRRAIQFSKIDPDQKREVLDNIRRAEVALTSRIQYIKKSID